METTETWELIAPSGARIPVRVELAASFWTKFRGLMLRPPLPAGTGLYFTGTNSIHMCFMRFPIDVIYFDKKGTVVKVVENLPPWTGLSACFRAKDCLEMNAGEAARLGIAVGMRLEKK